MRRSQLAGLQWGDLNFRLLTLRLRAETSKTRRSWTVPISEDRRDELLRLKVLSEQVIGKKLTIETPVFQVALFNPRYSPGGLTVDQISGAFRRIHQSTGIRISPHRLRHTMATIIANRPNPPLPLLKNQLGHTQLSTTLLYVSHDVEALRPLRAMLPEI